MIHPAIIKRLIREAGQILLLEIRSENNRPVLNPVFGTIANPETQTIELCGYIYSPSSRERPMFGGTFLEGDMIGIILAEKVTKETFSPNCILIADGRRYSVSYGADIRQRSKILYHRINLSPESRTQ